MVDFTTLLTPARTFIIERLGCDGRRSSLNTRFDKCGICGGNGKSCEDCSGKVNGSKFAQFIQQFQFSSPYNQHAFSDLQSALLPIEPPAPAER